MRISSIVRSKLTETITKEAEGKPDSWKERKWKDLNDTWKLIHNSTESFVCVKGKHDHCIDSTCTCDCHPKVQTV